VIVRGAIPNSAASALGRAGPAELQLGQDLGAGQGQPARAHAAVKGPVHPVVNPQIELAELLR
jgi:hypothetical protein